MMKIALAVLLSALVPLESWGDACFKKCNYTFSIGGEPVVCDVSGCWWDTNGDGLLAAPESYVADEDVTDALDTRLTSVEAAVTSAQDTADDAVALYNALPPGSSSTSAASGANVAGQTHILEHATPTSSKMCWASDPSADEWVCVTGTAVP